MTPLRDEVLGICVGTAFLAIGVAVGAVAVFRRRHGAAVFLWLGTWSALYGLQELGRANAVVAALPAAARGAVPYLNVASSYLMLVVGTLTWLELSQGAVKRALEASTVLGLAIAAAGIGTFAVTGDAEAFLLPNNVLAVVCLLLLCTVVALPTRLARRYLVRPEKGALFAGTMTFAVQGLYANVSRSLGHPSPRVLDWLGFAALLLALGHVALQMVLARERRLVSIENELAVARRLQLSILPSDVPRLAGLRVAAAYEPMTEVAGDFYEFLPGDAHRAGFLVADVSGHGVPAALIASMIKVAVQSVAAWADDPPQLLRRLGSALHGNLRGQYVTAACLWVDTEARVARYSAAGHPPLLHWRAATGEAARIESNGLLFGVSAEGDYPGSEIPFEAGDRFLLYSDGLTEAENPSGVFFGDERLDEVLSERRSGPVEELPRDLVAAVSSWRRTSSPQQDDITIVAVEVGRAAPGS